MSNIRLTDRGKPPSASRVVMTELVLPTHTNALGSIFGGTVMGWIDIAAAIAAGRHARTTVVTASVDALHFIAPIQLGHVVMIEARINRAFRTSLEVGVTVDSENPKTGEHRHNVTAYLTFVALDRDHRPVTVAQVAPQTAEDRRNYREALRRKKARLALAASLRN